MELKGKKINFLGDSITEGTGTSSIEHVYFEVLKRSAGLAEARGYGIGGTRLAKQIVPSEKPKYDHFFEERAREMDRDADVVVVFGGTNDFGHGDAPVGRPEDRTPDTFWGACHSLYTYLMTEYPDARIVVMTPCHRLNEHNTDGSEHNKAYNYGSLKDYVNIIREVAEYYSLPVCDLYANLGINPEIAPQREKYMPDGLHPSDAGNAKIAAYLEAFLKTI